MLERNPQIENSKTNRAGGIMKILISINLIFVILLIIRYIVDIMQENKELKEQIEEMDLLIGKANDKLRECKDE